jgi:hypothetical protein
MHGLSHSSRAWRWLAPALLWLCAWSFAGLARAEDRAGVDFFETRIRPVLVERCYKCHSQQAAKVKGGLRLDSRKGLLQGGDSGPAVVPGDPGKSLLIKAIRYTDSSLRMPPKRPLTAEQVADFESWVRQGAPDPRTETAQSYSADPGKRWAFQPPVDRPLPPVQHAEAVQSPIDRFLLAGLQAKGLGFAPPADRRTLLRRVTYDLTGLPPTPAEIDAFLADQSPDAFARVVDRLLASPRYGERWGRHWLDLVRYADDYEDAWRYRDWVVNAFNNDLPYDQFILAQVAGDLLPAPQPRSVNADGIVATTMLSIGQWSGLDHKKRLTDIVDDQIDIVGRSVLGLTVACARCHNHKFDPITTADYYGLAGIFLSSRIMSDLAYLSHGEHRLQIPLVAPAEVARHQEHQARIAEFERKLQAAVDRAYADIARRLAAQTGRYLVACYNYRNRPSSQEKPSASGYATRRSLQPFALEQWIPYLDGSRMADYKLLTMPVRDYDGEPGVLAWRTRAERPWWAANPTARDVAIETFLLPRGSVSINPGTEGGAVSWKSPLTTTVRITGKLTDGDPFDGAGVAWVIDNVAGGVRQELSSGSMANGGCKRLEHGRTPERLAAVPIQAGDQIVLHVKLREGDAHYDITNVELHIACVDGSAAWDLTQDVAGNLLEGNPHRDSRGHVGVWHFEDAADTNRMARMPAFEALLDRWKAATADLPSGKKPDRGVIEKAARDVQRAIDAEGPDGPLVRDLTGPRSPFWVNARDDAKFLPPAARDALAKLEAELQTLKASLPPLPCALGIQEGGLRYSLYPGFQDVPIHGRGSYEQLGERVPRHFPKALAGESQPPIRSGSGRLELARWLGSPDNPLTARVMVNRIWQHHFGEGIVRTPSNFGAKGERPSHPELLDYLARRFVASGWSVKAMHRLILLSTAYQQASKPSKEGWRLDPENRLLGHMNRRRLEAEALRDSVLAVAGRLDLRRGGPAEQDRANPRRMLYLKTSRANRGGLGPLFDAANPAMHVEKRTASTVAPQALFLMNSPLIVGELHALVNHPEVRAGKEPEPRVQALYRLIYGRKPTAAEVSLARNFLEVLKRDGSADKPSQLEPWETYAQALLLSNEFLFVD